MTSTGKALDWFAGDVLGSDADAASLIAAAAAVPPGAEGLVFLPYLAGERSPIWDPHARGAFVGLTLGHAAPHLARAIMEAAALLSHKKNPTDAEIKAALADNLCRCGTHLRIVRAVKRAAGAKT